MAILDVDDPFDDVDPEKRDYYRRLSQRTRVSAKRLLRSLSGFELVCEELDHGANHVVCVRRSPRLPGLFDILKVHGDITGEWMQAEAFASVIPSGWRCPAGLIAHDDDFLIASGAVRSTQEAQALEREIAAAAEPRFQQIAGGAGHELQQQTIAARNAVERYLQELRPGTDLREALVRLRARAAPEQIARSQYCLKQSLLDSFGRDDDRVIWDIAWLCQVLWAESEFEPFLGATVRPATPEDLDAFRRVRIVASRLAREPGWPQPDPLVPEPPPADLEPVPDQPPQDVPELLAQYLASRQCRCGRALTYVAHRVVDTDDDSVVLIACRCAAGHEQEIELG
jgi:hypothetical protein